MLKIYLPHADEDEVPCEAPSLVEPSLAAEESRPAAASAAAAASTNVTS